MKQKFTSLLFTKGISPLLALGAFANISYAQTTRTWDGGGTPATTFDLGPNWSGDVVPTGAAPGDTAQWDGTVTGPLSLNYTAAGTGAGLGTGAGISLNITSGQTSPLTINEASGTAGIRLRDLTVAPGAGALTFGGVTGTDFLNLGSASVVNHLWTNDSSNPVSFLSDVSFSAGNAVTHALTLTGTGDWNVSASLIKAAQGTINVIKSGSGTLNLGSVNSLGNAGFTINSGTINNTSGAGMTMTNTTQSWNGNFSFSTPTSTAVNDLSIGSGAVNLGAAAGTSRTITTNGAALLTVAGVIANGTGGNALIKSGTGPLKLDGNNTFSGGFTLNEGNLHIANNGVFGTGTLTLNGGALLPRVANRTIANPVTISGNFDLGVTNFNSQINLTGPVNLAGGTRTVTVPQTSVAVDATMTGVISNGGFTKAGTGLLAISGESTYSGPTTVTEGPLRLQGAGGINGSSGITINGDGASFIQNSSLALTSPITLTKGLLESTSTVGVVNIADSLGSVVSNGTGLTTFNAAALNFAGAATVNVRTTSPDAGIAAGTITTSGNDSAIIINVTKTTAWVNGPNKLISYTSFPSADIRDFEFSLISAPPLGARQSLGELVLSGNNIAVEVSGTTVYWTGLQSNQWTTSTVANPKNWKQTSDNVATDFLDADDVVFNDAPGANQTVQIDENFVTPTTTLFNNSSVNYVIASSSTFGIATGVLTKSGTGSVTLNTGNLYAGGTTLNAGTINVNRATALGTGALIINGGTLNNTSGAAVAFTNNPAQTWNGDFTFTGSNSLDLGKGAVSAPGTGERTVTITSGTLAVGELITAAGVGFTKQGTGTLALTSVGATTAASVVNGTLNVAAGTLQLNRVDAPDAASTGDLTVSGLTGTGTITNGSNFPRSLIVNASGSFGGTLANGGSGGLGFNKPGATNFTLTGNNSFTGATTVGGGILTITGTNATGGPVNINGGTTNPSILNLQNSNALGTSVVSAVTRNAGVQLEGGINLPSTVSFVLSSDGTSGATVPAAIDNMGGNNTINGNISMTTGGGGALLRANSGTLTMAGDITVATGQTSRSLSLDGTTNGNLFSGVLSDLSATSIAGLVKNGTGAWTITGTNTYTGPTTVNEGTLIVSGDYSSSATGAVTVATAATLGGNGDFGGSLTIAAGAHHALAVAATPGAQVTRSVASLDLSAVGDILDLTAAAAPANGSYILVSTTGGITGHTGGVLNDTVVNLTGLTGTVSVVGNDLVLTVGAASSGFATWIAGYPSIPLADRDPGDDPDGDGSTNMVEFALGGTPNNGSDNAKIFSSVADSDFDGDTQKELLITIAVRTGTGTFTGTTSKSAPSDDPAYTYTVQGSLDLITFGETVNVVPTAMPPAGVTLPAGYTWKTFSLNGSNGTANKGFLRVLVTR